MALFTPTLPQLKIDTSSYLGAQTPKTNYGFNTTLQSTIDKIASMYKPYTPITEQLNYDQYATPQREMYSQFVETSLRPEFERFTLNPFKRQAANMAAATGARFAGNAPRRYADALRQTNLQLEDQIASGQQTIEGLVNDFYNRQIQRSAQSPTQIINI